jgi:hypothetical protein
MQRISKYVRRNILAMVALFFALSGGAAWAANTITSADIVDGEVKSADIGDGQVKEADVGQGAVASAEVKNDSVANGDIAPNSLTSGRVADGSLTGTDVANNSLKGADVDESTLDVGDAARAYAFVNTIDCDNLTGVCAVEESKGISQVTRTDFGRYCVTAPGIDSDGTPASVTVDWPHTNDPTANASAMTGEGIGCGPGDDGFFVVTERLAEILVDADGGNNNATVAGPTEYANDVAFTIVIP